MPARTIDEVIIRLEEIIRLCRERKSRLGYFPALYRKVTIEVKKGIAAGKFEDGARMEKLDVIFANRYLEAWDQHERGEKPTNSWLVAFQAGRSRWPIVLQHLLLGMNAHINLDLGIAAARAAPAEALASLHNDFNAINGVLASLVDEVRSELEYIWPPLRFLARLTNRSEEMLINLSMAEARDQAWNLAERLAPLSPVEQERVIAEADGWTALFGRVVKDPPPFFNTLLIRTAEIKSVAKIIDILA